MRLSDEQRNRDNYLDIDSGILEYLKNKYLQESKLPRLFEEDEDFEEQDIKDSYVNLAIVKTEEQKDKEKGLQDKKRSEYEEGSLLGTYEDIHSVKEPVKVEGLFDIAKQSGGSKAQRLLVYGRAGIGKTTLMQYIAYKWAAEGLWRDKFKYVFLLPLRQIINGWDSIYKEGAIGLAHFIHYCCFNDEDIEISTIKEILRKKEALILLDGYDEITNVPESSKALTKKIVDSALPYEDVLMTSRFNAVAIEIQNKFDMCLENIGFINEDIKKYINKYYEHNRGLGKDLKTFLLNNKAVWGISHIPINLQLICYIWSDEKLKARLNNNHITFTYLYMQVTEKLMRRYISKVLKKDITNMDGYDIEEECTREYELLEKIAYIGMREGEIVLGSNILKQAGVAPKEYQILKDIGIIKAIGEGKRLSDKDHYFIHLTFQEYFAARCLIRMLSSNEEELVKEGVKFIEENKYSRIYERVVWFIAGLASKNKDDQALLHFWNVIINGSTDLGILNQAILMIRCLEEANLDERIPGRESIISYIKSLVEKNICIDTSIIESLSSSHNIIKKIGIIEHLISQFNDKDSRGRSAAVRALRNLKVEDKEIEREISKALINLLNDEDNDVRSDTIETLRKLRIEDKETTREIYEALINLLNNEDGNVRSAATEVLGELKIEDKEIIREISKALINLLNDEDGYMCSAAVVALGELKVEDKEIIREIYKALINLLNKGNHYARSAIIETLGGLKVEDKEVGREIYKTLINLLNNKDSKVRSAAVRVLGKLKVEDKEIIREISKILINLLNDEDHYVRYNIVWALRELKVENKEIIREISKALINLLNDKDSRVRSATIRVLGELKVEDKEIIREIYKALITLLNVEDMRSATVTALGWLKAEDKEIIREISKTLINLLNDEDHYVREAAVWALRGLKAEDKEIVREISKSLTNLLNDEDRDVRSVAVRALGELKVEDKEIEREIYKALINLLNDEDMHSAAIWALGRLKIEDKEIIREISKILINLLHDEDSSVREAATEALGKLKVEDKEIIKEIYKALINLLNDEDSYVRSTAAKSIISYITCSPNLIINEERMYPYLPSLIREHINVATTLDQGKIMLHRDKGLIGSLADKDKPIKEAENIFNSFYQYAMEQGIPTDMLDSILRCRKMVSISGLKINVDDIILSNTILTMNKHSLLDNSINLNCNSWTLSIVRKDERISNNPEHAFLLLEGRNIFYGGVIHRIELTQPDAKNAPKRSAIVVESYEDVRLFDLERVFQAILGNKEYPKEKFEANRHYYSKSCSVSYEVSMELLKEVEESKNHPPIYNIRGNSGISVPEGEHSCFTWAREKLQRHVSREEYEAMELESWRDRVVSQTSCYLRRDMRKKRECITLM